MYDPNSCIDRTMLAQLLSTELVNNSFNEIPNTFGTEKVYSRLEGRMVTTKVYTSIVDTEVRESGEDALRIFAFRGDTVIYQSRIYRRGASPADIVYRLSSKVVDVHKLAFELHQCDTCDSELSMSKKGSRYCKPCWLTAKTLE